MRIPCLFASFIIELALDQNFGTRFEEKEICILLERKGSCLSLKNMLMYMFLAQGDIEMSYAKVRTRATPSNFKP